MQFLPKVFDPLTRAMEKEDNFPDRNSLSEYLDAIIPGVSAWGEDLTETDFYVGSPWLELRDQDNFNDVVLHVFNQKNEYLRITNGDVKKGNWRLMNDGSNRMIVDFNKSSELYVLAYLDPPFFILRKHGDQGIGRRKYWVMGLEGVVGGLEWREYAQLLYNSHQEESNSMLYAAIFVIVIVAVLVLFSVI